MMMIGWLLCQSVACKFYLLVSKGRLFSANGNELAVFAGSWGFIEYTYIPLMVMILFFSQRLSRRRISTFRHSHGNFNSYSSYHSRSFFTLPLHTK
jgi:hypothetical protein